MRGQKNGVATITLIGYPISELRDHLEKQFTSEMSWESYGSYWSIDHIIPMSMFDHSDPEQIKKCWSLSNLRPLTISENSRKGNKV